MLSKIGCLFAFCAAFSSQLCSAEKKKPDEPEMVAKGFTEHYFAVPPDVDYPSCVAVSPSGVVFAGQDPYNVRANKSHTGRIMCYKDTTGAGKADKTTVFAENTSGPRGMCYVDGTLYVVGAPFLTAYKDDGSGKAASEEVLVSGYGYEPEKLAPDHSEAGVRMAIDGWLYLAVGDQGFLKAIAKDKTEMQLHGGGLCRIRPDGSEFELFCHGTRNTYDIAIDPLLNGYTRDNTNDGKAWNVRFAHMVYGAEYGYPSLFVSYSDEILPCLADWGGGSGTGVLYIQEPYMPEGFGNVLLTTDWGTGKTYWHTLQPDGSTFKVKQDVFMKGTRPLDLDIDGRGRIYIADWRGATYGREKDLKKPVGYIAVVQNEKGINPAEFPDLKQASDANLVDFISRESQVLRLNAQRELLRRPLKQENADALAAAFSGKGPLYARVAALFTYTQMLGVKAHPKIIELTENPEMREFAIRALADRKTQLEGLLPELFVKFLKDENPRVQVQALVALMRLNQPAAAPSIVPLLTHKDPEVSHLAMRALRSLNAIDVCLNAAAGASAETAAGALKVLRESHDEKTVQGLSELLTKAPDEARKALVRETLGRLYFREAPWDGKWWGIPPDTTGPHYKTEKWAQSAAIAKLLEGEFSKSDEAVQNGIFKIVARYKIPIAELPAAQARLSDPTAKLTPELGEVVVQLDALKSVHAPLLERVALEKNHSAKLRSDAVEALARVNAGSKDAAEIHDRAAAVLRTVDGLIGKKDNPKELNQSLAKLISGISAKDEAAPDLSRWAASSVQAIRESALGQLLKKKDDPAAKDAIDAAWKNTAWTEALASAIEKNRIAGYSDKLKALIADKNAGIARAAIRAAGSLGDDSFIEDLFDTAEHNRNLADALSALDKIKAEKVDAPRLALLAERAVKLSETHAADKDANIVNNSRALADRYVHEKKLPPDTAKALAARSLSAAGANTEPLVGDFQPSDDKYSATADPRYKELLQSMAGKSGDKDKGRELFASLSCNKCHTLTTTEPAKGPFLGDVGVRYKRPDLIESIVLPSEKITMGYEPRMVTIDGEDFVCFVTNESGEKFDMHLVSGETKTVLKKQVERERKLKLSVMPSGVVSKLTQKQFADLLTYLESLGVK